MKGKNIWMFGNGFKKKQAFCRVGCSSELFDSFKDIFSSLAICSSE
jgi:hypothetical protein